MGLAMAAVFSVTSAGFFKSAGAPPDQNIDVFGALTVFPGYIFDRLGTKNWVWRENADGDVPEYRITVRVKEEVSLGPGSFQLTVNGLLYTRIVGSTTTLIGVLSTPDIILPTGGSTQAIGAAMIDYINVNGLTFAGSEAADNFEPIDVFRPINTTATYVLKGGNDRLVTDNDGRDVVYAGAGDDVVETDGGNDRVDGGAGNDRVEMGAGDDVFIGGDGNDGEDVLFRNNNLGAGNDVFEGGRGNDVAWGDEGNDNLWGMSAALDTALLAAGDGDDILFGYNGNDRLYGGAGSDFLRGDAGNDLLVGGRQSDELRGGSGNDFLYGDLITTSDLREAGDDLLDGGSGNDVMRGGAGNDTYQVDSALDIVVELAGQGEDRVNASVSYTLLATASVEVLTASAFSDTPIELVGSAQANTINGHAGDNVIDGKGGNDTLRGSLGLDVFVFSTALSSTANVDRITDFNVTNDQIRLENAIFSSLTALGALSAAAFVTSATGLALDGADRIIYNTTTGRMTYDADGSGSLLPVTFAQLSTGLSLSAADFEIV